MLGEVKIVVSLHMVEDGEPYEVPRTWRERLFSRPWRPMKATRTVVPKKPRRDVLQMPDGSLVMHPAIAEELKRSALVGRQAPNAKLTGSGTESG